MARTARQRHLMAKFGLTEEQYQSILENQGGGCALCGKTTAQEGKNLAVDHLHAPPYTIRGILCSYCNHRVIGRHRDASLLRRMADYLEKDTGFRAPVAKKRSRRGNGKTSRSKTARY